MSIEILVSLSIFSLLNLFISIVNIFNISKLSDRILTLEYTLCYYNEDSDKSDSDKEDSNKSDSDLEDSKIKLD